MSKISVLDENLINKIAAGEVVERPASVVKELIENSLDANATKILVEIRDSGKGLIRISDNGEGMDEEDAKNCVIRHATSKINDVNDLFSIRTLGFRGEALASVAAVSQLSIITKHDEGLEGFNLVIEGGNLISSGVIAAERGTTIEVRNLFFNTPVRKKFLKTDAVELRHIIDIVTNYSLANEKISFKLVHEGRELLNSPSVKDQKNNLASIYGVTVTKELLCLEYHDDVIKIKGYISKPYQARNDKNQQVFFVNGRWIKSNDLSKSVYDGYRSLLFVNKHPVFVLNLEIDSEKIDVNVHPQKYEIKIEQKELVQKALSLAVNNTLKNNNLIPVVNVEFESSDDFSKINSNSLKDRKIKSKSSFEVSTQTILEIEIEKNLEKDVGEEAEKEKVKVIGELKSETEVVSNSTVKNGILSIKQKSKELMPETIKFPEIRLLGQVHKTFFVAETVGGIFFIDQHAAHERVMYEKFMGQLLDEKVYVQELLKEEVVELSIKEMVILEEEKEELVKFGFVFETFGNKTILLKTVPVIFERLQPKEMFNSLLNNLIEGNNSLMNLKEVIITRMACRAAVMAGDELTNLEIRNILDELQKCEHPYTCAHGRPTMFKTTVSELEKKFKRC